MTPLVLFWNRSASKKSAKSGKRERFTRSEWMAATPLTVWEPATARWPMRTIFGPPSSMMDMRCSLPTSPGKRDSTWWRKRQFRS